jgi:pilus assembly protein Flp/PilA
MAELLTALWHDESGQDMAEYGLLLALIAVVLVTAIVAFRGAIQNTFENATSVLNNGG